MAGDFEAREDDQTLGVVAVFRVGQEAVYCAFAELLGDVASEFALDGGEFAVVPGGDQVYASVLAGASGGVSGGPVGERLNAGETAAVERVGGKKRDDYLLPAGACGPGGGRLLGDLNYEIRVGARGVGVAGVRRWVRLVCDCVVGWDGFKLPLLGGCHGSVDISGDKIMVVRRDGCSLYLR